jgi:hypothetical protein
LSPTHAEVDEFADMCIGRVWVTIDYHGDVVVLDEEPLGRRRIDDRDEPLRTELFDRDRQMKATGK